MRRGLLTGIAIAIVAVAVVLMRSGGPSAYEIKMKLDNAGGLRDGSPVVVGGVQIGTARLAADFKQVTVTLDIDNRYKPIGKDAQAAIISQNVLGQKQVKLTVGNAANQPAPDGYVLPTAHTSTATDLDQLLSTLDPDTRMRLAVVVNELGTAFAGRKMDFQQFLDTFPPAVQSVSGVLAQLTKDNQTLGNLVDLSDAYVGSLTASRAELSHAIDVFGRTTETVAARRTELRETLRRAPAALVAARGFLSELRQTTGPLDQTANLLKATAPSVNTLISRIGPLTDAARPTLQLAEDRAAPALIGLSDISTAPAARVGTTLQNLLPIAQNQLPVLGRTLDQSADNTIATLQNWSRAIQFRDGLGHVFRGEASFSPALYNDLIKGLGVGNTNAANKKAAKKAPQDGAGPKNDTPAQPQTAPQKPLDPAGALGNLLKGTQQTTQQLQQFLDDLGTKPLLPGTKPLLPGSGSDDSSKSTQSLLDFLLKP